MKKDRTFFYRLLYPTPRALPWLILPASASIPLLFLARHIPLPLAALASLLALYVLLVLALRLPILWRAGLRYFHGMRARPWSEKWAVLSLFLGFGANFFYAVFKILTGARYGSVGLGTEAVFYIVLGVVRYSLVGEERRIAKKEHAARTRSEWAAVARCGRLLLLLDLAATAIIAEIARGRPRFPYSAFVIAITALYTAGRVALVVFQLVRLRHHARPLFSAIRALNLAASLFSIFSLTAVCLTRSTLSFSAQQTWNAVSGSAVLLALTALAVLLILRARRALSTQKSGET